MRKTLRCIFCDSPMLDIATGYEPNATYCKECNTVNGVLLEENAKKVLEILYKRKGAMSEIESIVKSYSMGDINTAIDLFLSYKGRLL